MTKISIGECIRAILQPDDYRMDLRYRPDHRMMDIFVYDICRHEKTESCVDSVRPSNAQPSRMESLTGLSVMVIFRGIVISFHLANGSLGLLGCCKFDDVGDEEMARDKRVEDSTEEQVLSSVVVAANANQESVRNLRVGTRIPSLRHTFI